MPQYLCVNCFNCRVYQVTTSNKTRSFKCRVCGEHQSLRKVFLQSSKAKDVRLMVQKLNASRDDDWKVEAEASSPQKEIKPDWSKFLDSSKLTIEDPQPAEAQWNRLTDDIDELEFDESP